MLICVILSVQMYDFLYMWKILILKKFKSLKKLKNLKVKFKELKASSYDL